MVRGDKQNRRGSDSKPIEKEHKRRKSDPTDKCEDENVDWGEFKTHIYINNDPNFGG